MGKAIHILTTDAALKHALVSRIGSSTRDGGNPGFGGEDHVLAGDLVIAPSSDCTPARCEELAHAAAKVIILAALPRADEEQRYSVAGASAYIPMTLDGDLLMKTVDRLNGC
jgi:L-aminopeptidase/D-esterase-like protein